MAFHPSSYPETSYRRRLQPADNYTPSARLVRFLKEREGLSRQPDFDGYGTYTVGYGVNYPNRNAALTAIRRLGGVPGRLTDAQATPDLIRTIREKEEKLQGVLNERGHRVWDSMRDYQQDAVRSLFYNLTERSGIQFLRKYINGDRVSQIPNALRLYTGSWSESNRNGLGYRRELERRMFIGDNALGSRGPTIADTIQGRTNDRTTGRSRHPAHRPPRHGTGENFADNGFAMTAPAPRHRRHRRPERAPEIMFIENPYDGGLEPAFFARPLFARGRAHAFKM